MKRLLILWILCLVTYLALKIAIDLSYFGWIDLRRLAVVEAAILPFGQAMVFWALGMGRKHTPSFDKASEPR
jgi:hypothetical protein